MLNKDNLEGYKKASDKRSREADRVTKDRRDLVEVIKSHLEALEELKELKEDIIQLKKDIVCNIEYPALKMERPIH